MIGQNERCLVCVEQVVRMTLVPLCVPIKQELKLVPRAFVKPGEDPKKARGAPVTKTFPSMVWCMNKESDCGEM